MTNGNYEWLDRNSLFTIFKKPILPYLPGLPVLQNTCCQIWISFNLYKNYRASKVIIKTLCQFLIKNKSVSTSEPYLVIIINDRSNISGSALKVFRLESRWNLDNHRKNNFKTTGEKKSSKKKTSVSTLAYSRGSPSKLCLQITHSGNFTVAQRFLKDQP